MSALINCEEGFHAELSVEIFFEICCSYMGAASYPSRNTFGKWSFDTKNRDLIVKISLEMSIFRRNHVVFKIFQLNWNSIEL